MDQFGPIVGAHLWNLGWVAKDDIPDVRQEVFFSAVRSLPSFNGSTFQALRAFMRQISVREAINYLRKKTAQMRIPEKMSQPIHAATDDEDDLELPSGWLDPLLQLQQDERHDLIKQALSSLALQKPDAAEILTLREFDGLAYEELAAALNIGVGVVKSRLHRSKQEFARVLQKLLQRNKIQSPHDI